jgi:hypothetical protein
MMIPTTGFNAGFWAGILKVCFGWQAASAAGAPDYGGFPPLACGPFDANFPIGSESS